MKFSWNYVRLKWRAIGLILLGQRQAALRCFDQMLSLHLQDAYALASRAHLRAELGDATGALQDYARLTALPGASAASFFNQGFLLEADQQIEAAEASFRRAVELDDQLDRAWFGLGLVLMRQSRLDEAINALKRNTQLQPMSPHGWCELARIHVKRQEPEEAAKIIRHLQGFEPKVAAQLARETGINARASLV
jgi:Tfp pilus assembly protein PilF